MNRTDTPRSSCREKALHHNEKWHTKREKPLVKLLHSGRRNGRAVTIYKLTLAITVLAVALIVTPSLSAPGIVEDILASPVRNAGGQTTEAAARIDYLSDMAVVVAIPALILLSIYIATVFNRFHGMFASHSHGKRCP